MSNKYSDLINQKKILEKMVINLQGLKDFVDTNKRNDYNNYIRLLEEFFNGINCNEVFWNCDGDDEKKQKTFDAWYEVIKVSLENQIEKINGELGKFERVNDGIEFLRCIKQNLIENCSDDKKHAQFVNGLRVAYMDIKQQNMRLNLNANDKAILELLDDMEDWLEAFMDMKSGVE